MTLQFETKQRQQPEQQKQLQEACLSCLILVRKEINLESSECKIPMKALTIIYSHSSRYCLRRLRLRLFSGTRTTMIVFEEGKKLPTTFAFALVEHRSVDEMGGSGQTTDFRCLVRLRLRMYLAGEVISMNTESIKSSTRLQNTRMLLNGKPLYILKLCSLSTISREYVAVCSIGSLPFRDLILGIAAENKSNTAQAWKVSKPLMDYIKSNLNESQQQAIHVGLSRNPFILIQGPPGTRKTQTILGLLSAILHAMPERVHSQSKLGTIKHGAELPIQEK